MDEVAPPFEPLKDFFTDPVVPALALDELEHSHPASPRRDSITSDDHVIGLLDPVTYCKGAALLRQVRYRMAVDATLPTGGMRRRLLAQRRVQTQPHKFFGGLGAGWEGAVRGFDRQET